MLCNSQSIEMTVMRESKESLRRCLLQRHIFTSQALHNFWNGAWNAKIRRISHLMAETVRNLQSYECAHTQLSEGVLAAFVEAHGVHGLTGGHFHAHVFSLRSEEIYQNPLHIVLMEMFSIISYTRTAHAGRKIKRETTYISSEGLKSWIPKWTTEPFLECLQLWAALAMHITALSRISATSVMSTNSISRASPPLSWIICEVSLSPRQLATTRRVSTWRSLKSCGKIKKTKCRRCGEHRPCTSCDRN